MENRNKIENKNEIKETAEQIIPDFWHWYFPRRPVAFLRFLLFCYFIQWFVWNAVTFINKGNLETIFFLQKTWKGFEGITLVFGPLLGTV